MKYINLIVCGLPERCTDAVDFCTHSNKYLSNQTKIDIEDLVETERLGRKSYGDRPRLLRVKLSEQSTRRSVLVACTKPGRTQNTGSAQVFIRPDLTLAQQAVDKKLREELLVKGKDNFFIKRGKVVPRNASLSTGAQSSNGQSEFPYNPKPSSNSLTRQSSHSFPSLHHYLPSNLSSANCAASHTNSQSNRVKHAGDLRDEAVGGVSPLINKHSRDLRDEAVGGVSPLVDFGEKPIGKYSILQRSGLPRIFTNSNSTHLRPPSNHGLYGHDFEDDEDEVIFKLRQPMDHLMMTSIIKPETNITSSLFTADSCKPNSNLTNTTLLSTGSTNTIPNSFNLSQSCHINQLSNVSLISSNSNRAFPNQLGQSVSVVVVDPVSAVVVDPVPADPIITDQGLVSSHGLAGTVVVESREMTDVNVTKDSC